MLRKGKHEPKADSRPAGGEGGPTKQMFFFLWTMIPTADSMRTLWTMFKPPKSRGFVLTCIIAFVGIQSLIVQHFFFLKHSQKAGKKIPLSSASPNNSSQCFKFELGVEWDIPGGDLGQGMNTQDVSYCCQACTNHERCQGFSWVAETKGCWLKETIPAIGKKANVTSGIKLANPNQKRTGFQAAFQVALKTKPAAVPLKKPVTPKCCTSNGNRFGAPGTTGDAGKPIIWFDSAARDFTESFAIGNGRLGSLLFFDAADDRLLLSEDTVWAGEPKRHPTCPDNLDPSKRNAKPVPQNLTWDGPHEKKFLLGQSSPTLFTDLEAAKKLCEKESAACSGLTFDVASKKWMLRVGTDLQPSPAGEISWLLKGAVRPDGVEFDSFKTAREKILNGDIAGAQKDLDAFPRGQTVSGFEYLAKLSLQTLGPRPVVKKYARRLWLDSGIAEATFTTKPQAPHAPKPATHKNGSKHTAAAPAPPPPSADADASANTLTDHKREAFASVGDDVIWEHMECHLQSQWGWTRHARPCLNISVSLMREGGGDTVQVHEEVANGPSGAQTKYSLIQLGPRSVMSSGYHGVAYAACVGVIVDGGAAWPTLVANSVHVTGMSKVDVVVAGATRYNKKTKLLDEDKNAPRVKCAETVKAAIVKGYEAVRKAHVAEHSALFGRSGLKISSRNQEAGESCPDQMTTKERVQRYSRACTGKAKNITEVVDVGLQQLMFDVGKYMLMGSSRPGSQPMNLVGIWGEGVRTPWSGDYHLNINFQMMYWAAEVVNLGETTEPLRSFMKALAERGESTAQCLYGSHGWVAHGFTDAWMSGRTLGDTAWSMCVVCGAWAALHLWDSHRHSPDPALLRASVLPVLGGAVEFFLDYLVARGPGGSVVTGPSHSPENAFKLPDGKFAHLAMAPAIDTAVVYDLMTSFVDGCVQTACLAAGGGAAAAECGATRCELAGRANATRQQLPNRGFPEVDGEGFLEEYLRGMPGMGKHSVPDHGHRHFSPLYALHPGDQIQPARTPGLSMAARNTLERKMAAGGGHTGWSAAWAGALYARLGDGEGVQRMVDRVIGRFSLANLFTTHPPLDNSVKGCAVCMKEGKLPDDEFYWGERGASGKNNFECLDQTKFQLDANMGILAAMSESLIQSRDRECSCLPMKRNISYHPPDGVSIPNPAAASQNSGRMRKRGQQGKRKGRRLSTHEGQEDVKSVGSSRGRRLLTWGLRGSQSDRLQQDVDGASAAGGRELWPSVGTVGKQGRQRIVLSPAGQTGRALKDLKSNLLSLGKNLTSSLFSSAEVEQPICSCGLSGASECEVEVLPALPSEWTEGEARGLRTRCGLQLDLAWHDSQLTSATVTWVWGHVPPRQVRIRSSAGHLRTDAGGFLGLIHSHSSAIANPVPWDPELTVVSGLVHGQAVKLVPATHA